MKGSQRDIAFYEVKLSCSSSVVTPQYNLKQIIQVFTYAVREGKATKSIKIGDTIHRMRIIDINESMDERFVVIFIVIDEQDAATPARRDKRDDSMNFATKGPNTEDEIGAHVFLRITPSDNHTYPMYLERVERLGHSNIRALFRQIISDYHDEEKAKNGLGMFFGPHNSGKRKTVGYKPVINIVGVPSAEFPEMVRKGLVSNIILQSEKQKSEFGGANFLVTKKKIMTLKFVKEGLSAYSDVWESFKSALRGKSSEWPHARINYETPDGDRGSAQMDTSTGNFLDDKFVRKVIVSPIVPPLATSAEGIVQYFARLVLSHPDLE